MTVTAEPTAASAPTTPATTPPALLALVRATTSLFLLAPPAALIAALALGLAPTVVDVVLGVALYVLSMGGVTIGYHRLLTHNGFRATPALRAALIGVGCLSMQGSPIGWVATHRKHHQFSDKPGDPHSPTLYGPGVWGAARGFWHAHAGWLFGSEHTDVPRYAPDMVKDPVVATVDKYWWAIGLSGMLVLPAAVGAAFGGWRGALGCVLWAGIIRAGIALHFAWLVNSYGHMWGKAPFVSHDQSKNVAWLSPFTLGEAFHNAHHAYPASPRHGLLPHQWDASARIIRWFEQAGWATHVKWYTHDQIMKKYRGPGGRARS